MFYIEGADPLIQRVKNERGAMKFLAILGAVAAVVRCAYAVDVKEFGAAGDGITDDTAAIQRAIDAGGIVHFPPGVYLSGSLYLKSNGGLCLDDNAVLKGHPDISKWPIRPVCEERSPFAQDGKVEAHLICCVDQTNVTVKGGIIDGNAAAFLGTETFKKAGARSFIRKKEKYPGQLIWFNGCDSVRVENTAIRDSQFWSLMFHGCRDVTVRGVCVYTRGDIMNADGIDIDCSSRVLVSGCFVDTGDDAIAVRAGLRGLKNPQPCENVVVTNCILRSDYANAIRVGVGSGEVRNCRFSDIILNNSRGGIHINPKFNDKSSGVAISDIVFDNISGEAMSFLYVTMDYLFSKKVTYTGVLENIKISNVKGVSSLPIVFNGNKTGKLRNITISDSEFTVRPFSKVPDSERKYFFVSTDRKDDAELLQTNMVENLVMENVNIRGF